MEKKLMARARNIKPALFANDELAELDPIDRLFFIGLWTIADFKGDIEWRAKKVKALVLPYDNCDAEQIAINLDNSGFVRFYSVQGQNYLNITKFSIHQNPHKNEREKGSNIPKFEDCYRADVDIKGLSINRDKNGTNPDKNGTAPADSLILIPDSFIPDPDSLQPQSEIVSEFDLVWEMYGKKGNKKTSCMKFKRMSVTNKKLMAEHLPKYIASQPDKQYRKNLETYINQECWNDEITSSVKPSINNIESQNYREGTF